MLDTLTPDDFVTYIIMFWFVAMPVGLVALGWWCYCNARAIRKHRQIADNNIADQACSDIRYRENMADEIGGIIRIIQSHTASIAALEDGLKIKPCDYGESIIATADTMSDQYNYNKLVTQALQKVLCSKKKLSKPPKSLKDKVLAASKRKRK